MRGDIGFTGTHRGMNSHQKDEIEAYLTGLFHQGWRRFRHGDCVGADAQAAGIARKVGYYIIGHPGINPNRPDDDSNRAYFPSDETLPPGPFITRDHVIVDESVLMLGAPFRGHEELRSGTWATIRYTKKVNKSLVIAWPDRRIECVIPVKF